MKKNAHTRIDHPYRLFLEGIPEAAVILSAGGEILHANRALAKLLGKTMPRITGVPLRDFVNPDSRRVFDATLKRMPATSARKEMALDAARGESVPVLVSRCRLPKDDGKKICLIMKDLRAMKERRGGLRESESSALAERQRLYEVMETLPAYVVLLSPDYHVPFANKFFRDRFGESRGRRCFEYLFGRKEPCESCESYKAMRTGERHHWEWTGPDGRTTMCMISRSGIGTALPSSWRWASI